MRLVPHSVATAMLRLSKRALTEVARVARRMERSFVMPLSKYTAIDGVVIVDQSKKGK